MSHPDNARASANTTRLRPVLRLRDLIFYGIVIIQPIAPVPIFGVTQKLSMGFAVTAVAISGIAMMLTAFSYGRLAALYPTAGSAYSYVGRGLNPHLGFLAGWAMALDYLVLPIVAIIQAALAAHRLVPMISYTEWAMAFVALLTAVTLWGIRATARVNIALLACMFLVCGAFVYLALLYLGHQDGVRALVSIKPFYDPATFDWRAVSTATAFAALTYIGFDGVTTLAEDVENPRRNVLIAIVSVCALTTLLSCLLVYLAQRVWPDYHTFANIETAFMDVTRRVGGAPLFQAMGVVILLGSLGSGLSGEVAAARLLYAMGRDGVLPRKFFGYINTMRSVPTLNVLLIAAITLFGCLGFDLEKAGDLLNFGAFLSFMGVNLAAIRQYFFLPPASHKRRIFPDLAVPGAGFLFCLAMWMSLPTPAKVVGSLWFLAGIIYSALRTRGFRVRPMMIDFAE